MTGIHLVVTSQVVVPAAHRQLQTASMTVPVKLAVEAWSRHILKTNTIEVDSLMQLYLCQTQN